MTDPTAVFIIPPDPWDLERMVYELKQRPRLAQHIRGLLVKAVNGDVEAQDTLYLWYMPADDELAALGLPAAPLRCTEHAHLLIAAGPGQ